MRCCWKIHDTFHIYLAKLIAIMFFGQQFLVSPVPQSKSVPQEPEPPRKSMCVTKKQPRNKCSVKEFLQFFFSFFFFVPLFRLHSHPSLPTRCRAPPCTVPIRSGRVCLPLCVYTFDSFNAFRMKWETHPNRSEPRENRGPDPSYAGTDRFDRQEKRKNREADRQTDRQTRTVEVVLFGLLI